MQWITCVLLAIRPIIVSTAYKTSRVSNISEEEGKKKKKNRNVLFEVSVAQVSATA